MENFSQLKKGDIVVFTDNGNEFVMVFKHFRGSDTNIPKRGGGTFNPSDFGSFAHGRREITLKRTDNIRLLEQADAERLKDQIAYAIYFFNKLHLKN